MRGCPPPETVVGVQAPLNVVLNCSLFVFYRHSYFLFFLTSLFPGLADNEGKRVDLLIPIIRIFNGALITFKSNGAFNSPKLFDVFF